MVGTQRAENTNPRAPQAVPALTVPSRAKMGGYSLAPLQRLAPHHQEQAELQDVPRELVVQPKLETHTWHLTLSECERLGEDGTRGLQNH